MSALSAPSIDTDRGAAVPPGERTKEGDTSSGGTPASASGIQAADETSVVRVTLEAVTPLPNRASPTHSPNIQRHNQPVILFVTVCTRDRRNILACDRAHAALRDAWARAGQYRVGSYVVMPDHVHLFCSPATCETENVQKWVAYWKRLVSTALKDQSPVWQRHCWDTQLRDVHHYGEKWEYVVGNPVRKQIAAQAEDWPYQGCLNELRW